MATPLPNGWEAKRAPRSGKVYFIDHTNQTTSWDDPRPLPQGYEAKRTSTGRPFWITRTHPGGELPEDWEAKVAGNGKVYFLDHTRQTTTWNDPRPLPSGFEMKGQGVNTFFLTWTDPRPQFILAEDVDLPRGTLSNSHGAENRKQKDSSGRIRGHSLDKEWYADVFRMAMSNRELTTDEEAFLATIRQKLNITDDEHKEVMRETGWSQKDIDNAKEENQKSAECLICMDAVANHVVMDCMHLCLCEDCALQYKGIHRSDGCPVCRGEIADIRKVY